jgi:hypothetical protein
LARERDEVLFTYLHACGGDSPYGLLGDYAAVASDTDSAAIWLPSSSAASFSAEP